jgi:8-oxo-dGTP pyrophosphatase MutT (NUDIX family)
VHSLSDFKILTEGSFRQADVEVLYVAGAGSAMPKDRTIETLIEESWSTAVGEAKKRHVKIFNGMLFRLKNMTVTSSNTLRLELGDTDYKQYVATRAERFYRNRQPDLLANPLAICIAIGTSEGNIITEKRGKVDVYSGQYHVIGGYMDRSQDFRNGMPDPFQAIAREVKEEVGLKLQVDTIQLMGMVYDLVTPHPEMCFCAESNLSSKEITNIFLNSEKDREVDKLEYIVSSEDKLAKFIQSQRSLTSITGQVCLTLYGKHKYGTQWFRKVIDTL